MPGFCVLHHLPEVVQTCVTESVMPFNHLVLCYPLLFLNSIFPSMRVFSNESALHIRWPKCWSFNFSVSPSSEFSGLISFKIDWFDHLAVQGILMSPLQHHNSFTIVCESAFISIKLSRRNIVCSNLGQTMGWLSL